MEGSRTFNVNLISPCPILHIEYHKLTYTLLFMSIKWFIFAVSMRRVCRGLLPGKSTLPLAVTFLLHNLTTMAAYQTSPALKAEKTTLRKKIQSTLNELDDAYLNQQVGNLFCLVFAKCISISHPF